MPTIIADGVEISFSSDGTKAFGVKNGFSTPAVTLPGKFTVNEDIIRNLQSLLGRMEIRHTSLMDDFDKVDRFPNSKDFKMNRYARYLVGRILIMNDDINALRSATCGESIE
jgi:hypothetical protein